MENVEIAEVLKEVADLLEIQDANPFRIRAFRNAVRTVEAQTVPLRRMVDDGETLTALPAIGKGVAGYIEELIATGGLEMLEELHDEIPASLIEFMRLPGLGPKKARKLWNELGVDSIEALKAAAEAGEVAVLEGFGVKTQDRILSGIERLTSTEQRFRLSEVDELLPPLLDHMRAAPGLTRLEVAGSYRRRRETIGDIDLLALGDDAGAISRWLVEHPSVVSVIGAGGTRTSITLRSGLQVDLRIVPAASWGAALVYFTGSKEHNIKLRQRALDRELRISEYGVFPAEASEEDESGERGVASVGEPVAGATEEDVYASVGLPWIPPELRTDRGEIAAAEAGELPELIRREDLKGDLQMHSTWSDGRDSIEEMLGACVDRGYEYFAITDHSKALAMVEGLDAEKLGRQWAEIDEVEARHPEIRILRSLEVDILKDGSLDLEDEWLERLDLVVVSIHSFFGLEAAEQTDRVLRALRHPQVDILAHPTGRILNRRPPIDMDVDEVLKTAAELGVAVELNAHPNRLDLRDTHLIRAKELGAKVVISTDAHRTGELDLIRYGVEQARRAWLTPADVINTRPLEEFLAELRGSRSA